MPPRKRIIRAASFHDPRLIPEMMYASSYLNREVLPGMQDFDVMNYALEQGDNIIISGPTGPGKTSMAMAFAARRRLPFYSVPSSDSFEPSQVFGKWNPLPDGRFGWVDGPGTRVARDGGVMLINEINMLPPRMAAGLFALLDKRREITLLDHDSEVVRAHRPNCWCDLPEDECKARWLLIVADYNPGYEGTRRMNEALLNRFPIKLTFDYDSGIELALTKAPELLAIAEKIRRDVTTYSAPVTTNMLMEHVRHHREAGLPFANMCFVNAFPDDERPAILAILDAAEKNLRKDVGSADEEDDYGVVGIDWADEDEDDE